MDNTTIIISKTDTYGKLIKEKRKELGFSGELLAELSNRSDRALRSIESGNSIPSLDTVLNIAFALGMDLGDLNCLVKDPYSDDG